MTLIPRPIVDLSHHQPPERCDWAKARGAGIVGAIFKVGQGASSRDPAFADHTYAAYQAGVPLLGGYLFLTDDDPAAQADNLLNTMSYEYRDDLTDRLVALDLEANPMGATATIAGAAEVVTAIHTRLGRYPVLYMGRYGPDGRGTALPHGVLSQCDLWLPSYGTKPRLPKGFDPAAPLGKHEGGWGLWQDTDGRSNSGTLVPGLGVVDQSRPLLRNTLDDLTAWWGK